MRAAQASRSDVIVRLMDERISMEKPHLFYRLDSVSGCHVTLCK